MLYAFLLQVTTLFVAIFPATTYSLRSMNCVVIELLVWLLICCVLIELLCGYWTNKKENCDSLVNTILDNCYYNLRLILQLTTEQSSPNNYYASKVNHLKQTKPSQWWSAVKWIADMALAPGSDPLFANLQIESSALLSEQEIVNEINSVFL